MRRRDRPCGPYTERESLFASAKARPRPQRPPTNGAESEVRGMSRSFVNLMLGSVLSAITSFKEVASLSRRCWKEQGESGVPERTILIKECMMCEDG